MNTEIKNPKLPKQIRQQMAEIEEMEKNLPVNDEQDVDIDALLNEKEPLVEEKQQDNKDTEKPLENEKLENTVEVEEVSSESPKEDFEQKYKSLKGKYDKEVPDLHAQLKVLRAEFDALNAKKIVNEQLKEPEIKPRGKLVTDEDREEFGTDLLDVQRRVAQEVVEEYSKRLEEQNKSIDEIKSNVDKTGTDLEEMVFRQQLNKAIPDFDSINQDPKWIEWLDTVDPILQGSRREPAERAYKDRDINFISNYVNIYKQSLKPTPDDKSSEIEKQVDPGNIVSPDVRKNEKKRTLTVQQYDKLWRSVEALNKSKQYERAEKLEKELTAAFREGRII